MLSVMQQFKQYLSQMIILGYNSGSYDNNLIRGEVTTILCMLEENNAKQSACHKFINLNDMYLWNDNEFIEEDEIYEEDGVWEEE